MDLTEQRIILDRNFERALKTVLDAFIDEGFIITAADAGDLRRRDDVNGRRRYALLDASRMELPCGSADTASRPGRAGCQISMLELPGPCTLVTIANAGIDHRVRDVIRVLVRAATRNCA